MTKLNLTFVGLYEEQNYGDKIIADCTEWLYFQELKGYEYNIKRLCIDYVEKNHKLTLTYRAINKLKRILFRNKNKIDSSQKYLIKKYKEYYESNIQGSDIIIFTGGGLIKYSYQFFWGSIVALLESAYKYKIPVFFNSVGIEGYDENNYKCRMLKDALNIPIIKAITTRDDLKTLKEKYFDGNPQMHCDFVCDPAVWISEIYDIKKDETSDIIGIGIGRANLFVDNGINYTKEDLFLLYVNLVKAMLAKKMKVKLFTNGLYMDNDFALIIQTKLREFGLNVDLLIPETPQKLVEIIASFKATIATRLHSNIIAYSLDIPSVGLVWNDKLSFFGNNIGASEYYLCHDNFQIDTIIKTLETAIQNGYNYEIREKFRSSIIKDIQQNIRMLISNKF